MNWIPEILYEENEDGSSSNIPFVMVPQDEEMPKLLYVFESRETGEIEPGEEGEDLPVVQWDLHQYADMSILKDNLSLEEYDKVRKVLDLEPMVDAVEKGKKLTQDVRNVVTSMDR